MATSRRRKNEEQMGGAPAWMVTYGDLMSLLLTFFVLLLSFSTIQEEDFNKAMMSFQGALGIFDKSPMVVEPTIIPRPQMSSATIERLAREVKRRLQVLGKEGDVEVTYDKGGFRIELPSGVLFPSGQAQLSSAAPDVLTSVQDVLEEVGGLAFFEVRGHTDDVPVSAGSPFEDNWDLSYHRAKAVIDYLSDSGAIPKERFEVVALGPSQPIATNDTPEGRATNRRVEILVRADMSEERVKAMQQRVRGLDFNNPGQMEQVEPGAPVSVGPVTEGP